MQYRVAYLALMLSTALVAASCSSSPRERGLSGAQPAAAGEAVVVVKNHNWSDMTVYLVRGGARARLGTVTSMNRQTFTVPRALMPSSSDIRILADPIGSRTTYLTEVILLSPGQTLDLTLENNLNLSSYSVW